MIRLIDGRGQIGKELKECNEFVDLDAVIYHSWNFVDKTESVQKKCFDKFVEYVDNNKHERIAFISTYTTTWTPYLKYKLKAELYLLESVECSKVFRLPCLLGKGVCQGFKDGSMEPDSKDMEIMTISQAVRAIIRDLLENEWHEKIVRVRGVVSNPQLIYNLIRFGKDD